MPIITKIEQQKKRSDRYSIFVDGRYSFSLSEAELASSQLRRGRELAMAELNDWLEKSKQSKAYDRALNFLSYRPRSIKEVADYLRRKEYGEPEVASVLERLKEQGFLNDRAFTQSWVEHRNLLKPSSKRRLIQELRQKGVSAEITGEVLSRIDPAAETEAIKQIARKKIALAKYQDQRKLTEFLLRQGFDYPQIKLALEELSS